MQKVVSVSAANIRPNKFGEPDFDGVINQVLQKNESRRLEAIYPILGEYGTTRLLVVLSDENPASSQ